MDALRLDELRAAIQIDARPVAIAGVCMLEVLARLSLVPDVLIYVRRMRSWGWADMDGLVGNEIEECEAQGRRATAMHREVRDYHRKYLPHEKAHILLDRVDER